jgi:DNA-binding CsgD family transcriptional regulator
MVLDLDGLYDAIEDDASFGRLAELVAAACGTRSAMIHHLSASGELYFGQINHFPAAAIQLYYDEFARADPWAAAAARTGSFGRAVALDALVPPERFMETALFNEVFRPIGDDTARCVGIISAPGPDMLIIGAQRAAGEAEFDAADAARLDIVYGHVRRILRLRRLLARERAETRTLEQMVNASDRAIIAVDRRMRIRRASAAAERCLDASFGVTVRQGVLRFADREVDAGIRVAVAATIDRAVVPQAAFLCPRPFGAPALRILVLPGGSIGEDGALLFIEHPAAPGMNGPSPVRQWAQAYSLTASEIAVAERLSNGLSLEEIAADRGVRVETVRTQLKSLFTKTGTNRQSDLMALLARLPRPL